MLGAGRLYFDVVERSLVGEVLVAHRHGALLDDVVDPPQKTVRRSLTLAQPDQGLHLSGEAVAGLQHRQLPAEILGLPPQGVAHQHRRLVVEVVAGGERVVTAAAGGLVEQVALRQAACRTGRPPGRPGTGGDVEAVSLRQIDGVEGETPALRVAAGKAGGRLAVVADAESQVEAVGVVAEVDQDVPHGQAVLAARDRHQHPLAGLEHAEAADSSCHLIAAQAQKMLTAEVGVVAPDIDHR